VIETIEFPRPRDGGAVEVSYPFTFKLEWRAMIDDG
jgi:hypothetical protein